MYHTEPPTDKTIREWYTNSSRVAACALQNEQDVRAHGSGRPVRITVSNVDNSLFYQLDTKIFYFLKTFITFLYMFRALLRSSSGGRICISTASGLVTLFR